MRCNMNKKIPITKQLHFWKRVTLLLLLMCSCITLTGCKKKTYLSHAVAIAYKDNLAYLIDSANNSFSLAEYSEIIPIFDEYLTVKKNNKYGFIKNTGEVVIKPTYQYAGLMREDKAVVVKDNTTYIINLAGDIIYTFPIGYTSYSYFSENILLIEKDGLLGYLKYDNNNFTIMVEPVYQTANIFKDGFAAIGKKIDDNIKYSYLKNDGTLLFEDFQWDFTENFYDGWGRVYINNYYHYIKSETTPDGEAIYLKKTSDNFPVSYQYAQHFENGYAVVANYAYKADTVNRYYKVFSFVDTNGNTKYDTAIKNEAPSNPNAFWPSSLTIFDDILFFRCGGNTGAWKIFYETILVDYYGDGDITIEFKEAEWMLSEDNEMLTQYMKDNNLTYLSATSYFQFPLEIGTFEKLADEDAAIASIRINGNKMALIKITIATITNKNDTTTKQAQIEYLFAPEYDNIVY